MKQTCDYWSNETKRIIEKYRDLYKRERVSFNDYTIGYKCCYVYKTIELERRCTEATKIFNNLHKEIDKFPKCYRGIIYSNLRRFKL